MPKLLNVNIDHIATLRNARGTTWPDPVQAAFIAEDAGANGITVHLREDRRHITDHDVTMLRKTIKTRMNLEIAITEEMIAFACHLRPDLCCLVPEKRQELTTEGGLDVAKQQKEISYAINRLSESDIIVSLFIDADKKQIEAAAEINSPYIEIHTGCYANTRNEAERIVELERIRQAVDYATSLGLKVNAGHGLNYQNVQSIAMLSFIHELNIGHSIISRAIICGLDQAIKHMIYLIHTTRS